MKCLKVPKKEGEEVRNKLLEEELLYKKGEISSSEDDQALFLPLKDFGEKELEKFEKMGYEVVEKEIEERERIDRNYEDLVDIPEDLKIHLPSSYDIVGDIALIKLPEELGSYKGEIGEAILETHKNLETVLEDKGVHGKFRIREVEHIAGEEKTVTVYREHGAEFEIDVSEVYFSPRLATERWRVVKKVKEDETVFDMFAGAGPYTVLIGREVDVDHIYSVDLNPKAVKFLMKNVERNDLGTKVTTYEGDARKIAERLKVDRIIMNLPHSSEEFIRPALKALDDKGMIHYYEIGEESEKEERLQKLLSEIREENLEVDVKEEREVRTYSATQVQMAYDLYLEKT